MPSEQTSNNRENAETNPSPTIASPESDHTRDVPEQQDKISERALVDRINASDRWIIGLTAVIAFTGIVGAYIFKKQLDVMQGQLNEMKSQRLITIAQIRANMARKGVQPTPIDKDGKIVGTGDAAAWRFTPIFKNGGATNAIDFNGWWDIAAKTITDRRIDGDVECRISIEPPEETTISSVVAPGDEPKFGSRELSAADVLAASGATPSKAIIAKGYFDYKDIFFPETPVRHSEWCIWLVPNEPERNIWSPVTLRNK